MPDGSPTATLAGIAVCLVLSAFYSGSETALTSLGDANARRMFEASGGARGFRYLVEEPTIVLTTILIGNNLVNITASSLATLAAEQLLGGANAPAWVNPVAVAIGVMTLLLLTFGEITPKSLARANAEALAPYLLTALVPQIIVLRPISTVFVATSLLVSRLAGSSLDADAPLVSDDQIAYLLKLGRQEGSLTPEREELLRASFRFTETAVREVMVPRQDIAMVPIDITRSDLLATIEQVGHSRLPIFDGTSDDVVGFVYAKDLLTTMRHPKPSARFDVRDLLREPLFVPPSKPIVNLFREMKVHRVHMAVVLDEFGTVAGLVTLEDVLEAFFGDIRDEYDAETDPIQQLGPSVWRVMGRANLTDLADAMGHEALDDPDCDTVGGLIAKHSGHVGQAGLELAVAGVRLRVEEADPRRVLWVHVERLPEPEVSP